MSGSSNRLRRDNLIRILESLWLNPDRSRADLARELRLDRSTVGALIDQMVENNILKQSPDENSGPRGGRPPVLLSFVPGFAYSIGVELTYPHIRLNALDINGDLLGERDIPVNEYGPQVIDTLAVETARFRQSLDSSFKDRPGLISIGVGVSGVVDDLKKEIILSDALRIKHPLAVTEPLEAVHRVPVTLLNDARASALREAGLKKKQDLLLVLVELRPGEPDDNIGIGAGLVLGNQLIHGHTIAHLVKPRECSYKENMEGFVEELGRSLALIVNVTGINEVVVGGDVDDIMEHLGRSLINNTSREGIDRATPLKVSRASGEANAVASGAAYAAVKSLFSSLEFPVEYSENIR